MLSPSACAGAAICRTAMAARCDRNFKKRPEDERRLIVGGGWASVSIEPSAGLAPADRIGICRRIWRGLPGQDGMDLCNRVSGPALPTQWRGYKTMVSKDLHLYEEIMLLALRDEEGTVASGAMYNYAVGGAILAELLLEQRLCIEEPRKKKKLVTLADEAPVGDELIDECMGKIAGARRRKRPEGWVSHFASIKQLKHRVARQLCRRGILEADEDKVLLLFTRKIYPEINPEPERRIIERLREAIFTDTDDIDPRTVVLVSLAGGTGILPVIFNKKELKARKKRIEQITNGEVTGKAAKDAIAAMQAAVMVACITPVIVSRACTH